MSTPQVFAILVTYNGARWLKACLDSLSASVPAPAIVVVDNASSDETVAIARSHPGVTVIETGANLGFGRANNIGMAHALAQGADYCFILNQDAHVAPDAIALLVEQAGQPGAPGILCPLQLDDSGKAIDPTFLEYYVARFAPALVSDALLGRLATVYPASAMPAAAWLLSRKLLESVGGFDPLFFMYSEDDDLCERAAYHGFRLALVPAAHFYHCRGFHGDVRSETSMRKLSRKASRFRSVLVREAKRPRGNFWKNAWQASWLRLAEGSGQLLAHLDWITFLASLLAVARVAGELPRIRQHRSICMGNGPHWLPGEKQGGGQGT